MEQYDYDTKKAKILAKFEELKSYKFCSYFKWFEKNGEKWMSECFENNPVSDYIAPGDLIKI